MRTLPLLLLLLASVLSADQVVLKNGDKLTGSVIKKDGGKLTIKSEFLGEVSMPWAAVQSLVTDDAVTVELPGDQRVAGKLSLTAGTVEIATPQGVRRAPVADIGDVRNPAEQKTWERLQHPRLSELWGGFFDLGYAMARGNAKTETLTTNFNATRVTRKDKIILNFNQIYAAARVDGVNSQTAGALRGGWSYNRDLNPHIFVSTINDYEHDRFQSLDLRFVAGGGLGVNLIKRPATSLSFTGAGDYARESFSTGLHRDSAELNFGDDFTHKFSAVTNVTQSFRMFPNLSTPGEYRVNFDLAAVTSIKKWLGWHVTFSDRYLSNPLFGRQRNDLLLSTGLRMSFGPPK